MAKSIPNLANRVRVLVNENLEAAVSWLQLQGSPQEVCELFDQAVRDLYWLDKGAASLVRIGPPGIAYGLSEAQKVEASDPETSERLKAQAKTLAYNVAANCWPGWGDEGVSFSESEIRVGLAAAETNLSLAIELQKPPGKVAAAHWLKAALELALGQFERAERSADQAVLFSQRASDAVFAAYALGFKGLVVWASGSTESGQSHFLKGLKDLEELGSEAALSYRSQLEVARTVFVKESP